MVNEVKTRTGTRSNRRSKMAKNVGWRRRGRYYVTGARQQEFSEAAEWSWIRPDIMGLLQQVANELIPADHEHFESLVWPCMTARWHHWRHKHSYVPFFRCLIDCLPVRSLTSGLHHKILWKEIYQTRAYDFGVQLSFSAEPPPPWFEFLVILTSVYHGRSGEASSVKNALKTKGEIGQICHRKCSLV